MTSKQPQEIYTTKFEVFGKVQGVFFRKHTQRQAEELGVHGWAMNTPKGTVVGEIQAPGPAFRAMKEWLSKVGSPKSRIQRVVWSDQKIITAYSYPDFSIRK